MPGVGQNLSNHAIVFVGMLQKPRRAAGGAHPPASDDVLPLFVGPAGRAAHRHVHQRAVQDLVEPARLAGRQPGADAAQADGARPRVAEVGGRARAAGGVQFHRPRARPAALHAGLPPLGRGAGAREGARDERRHVPGEVRRPAAAAQPPQHQEQDPERGGRQADRSGAAARRADLLDARRPQGRSAASWCRTTTRWPITSARTSPARSIRSAPAG